MREGRTQLGGRGRSYLVDNKQEVHFGSLHVKRIHWDGRRMKTSVWKSAAAVREIVNPEDYRRKLQTTPRLIYPDALLAEANNQPLREQPISRKVHQIGSRCRDFHACCVLAEMSRGYRQTRL
jgi:hypothetical protein